MIPHRKPIRVVEKVEVHSEKSWRCPLIELPLDWLGYDPERGLPAYWVVEWMAQASALGLAVFHDGEEARGGRLALIRSFETEEFFLQPQPDWAIEVEKLQGEGGGIFLFRASLTSEGGSKVDARAEFCVWIEA